MARGLSNIVKCDPKETNLILAEAPNAPTSLQTNCDQIVFEEFEFASYRRCIGENPLVQPLRGSMANGR